MIKKIVSDTLGLSDIGKILKAEDSQNSISSNFLLPNEKIQFLIKSSADEYCFTNLALIHVDGTSATSKKKLVKRYDYYKHPIHDVKFETAGTIDLDTEIKFSTGDLFHSIDVKKSQAKELMEIYITLMRLSKEIMRNKIAYEDHENSLEMSLSALKGARREGSNSLAEDFQALSEMIFTKKREARENYIITDYGYIFE